MKNWLIQAITFNWLSQNRQICTKYAFWDFLSWYRGGGGVGGSYGGGAILGGAIDLKGVSKGGGGGGIDLNLQGHLAISTQKPEFNVTLLHWSGQPRGATRPKRALVRFILF